MNRADEKRAFEAMLAEISDSDEDLDNNQNYYVRSSNNSNNNGRASSTGIPNMGRGDSKQVGNGNMIRKDSMKIESNYNMNNNTNGNAPASTRRSVTLSKEEEEIENFGVKNSLTPEETHQNQLNTTKKWLMKPCNRNDKSAMKCFVERERSTLGLQTIYRLYLEGGENTQPRFMMSAKKKVNKQTSYYLISLDQDPSDDRGSDAVIGRVRGNAVGSRYIITDSGLAPEKTVAPSMLRKELCVVAFEFDSGGPSRIEAWIPYVSVSGAPSIWQPDHDSKSMDAVIDDLLATNYNFNLPTSSNSNSNSALSNTRRSSSSNNNNLLALANEMIYLKNKMPKWDEAHGGHVLNFQGRVTESSVKNFQLCCADANNNVVEDSEEVILQFGRVGKNKFTLDLRYPLSPLQAFGVCVACLDGKIADRKGYEYLKRLTGGSAGASSSNNSSSNLNANNTSTNGNSNGNGSGNDHAADSKDDGSAPKRQGSMKGSSSLMDSLPSGQYLKDKFYRSFK